MKDKVISYSSPNSKLQKVDVLNTKQSLFKSENGSFFKMFEWILCWELLSFLIFDSELLFVMYFADTFLIHT